MNPFDPYAGSRLESAPGHAIGQTIVRGSSQVVYETSWFPARTSKGTFGWEVIALPANVTLQVTVQKKFRDETDDEAKDTETVTFTSAGVQTVRVTTLDDLVRYELTIAGSASVGHCHWRELEPSWEAS